jgi:CelD/BcsL family acetyltransferase involved in cellulose biosynthesis
VFADPSVGRFQAEAAPALLDAGLLRLHVLRVDGMVAAACYALLPAGRVVFYLTGFDAAHAAVSPGTLLLAAMLEQAIAERRREADFGRGNEGYKYAWGGVDRHNRAVQFRRMSA